MKNIRIRMALALVFLLAGTMVRAQGNSEQAHLQALNNSVLRLYGQVVAADASQQASLRSQASAVISERFAALQTLISQDPEAALQLSFDSNLLTALAAAFPDSTSQLESHGTWEGVVDYVILDDASLLNHRIDITVASDDDTFQVHFAEHEPGWLKCGDMVQVSGVRAGDQVAAADGSVSGSVAAAGCTLTGDQKIVAILVNFPSATLPSSVTPSMVQSIMFGSSGKSVNTYWQEASYGMASASGVVVGPYTLSQDYTCNDYYAIRSAAIAAADAAVDFRNYTRVMIVMARPASCGWAGLGTLGCSSLSSADGSFTASTSWLIANYMGDTNNGTKLTTHEGGHNLTLHHASSRAFTDGNGSPEPLGGLGVTGSLSEYGSTSNTMGSWNFGQYDAPHKQRLGWLTGSDIQTVQSNGSFSVVPYELTTGLRALKVQRGTGNNAWLWLEYRQAIGQYDNTLPAGARNGALIHYEDSQTGTHTHLLDFTPGSPGGFSDAALFGSWSDPYTNLTVNVQSATSSSMGVTVSYGAVPCSAADPTISISPSSQSGVAGDDFVYTVTVTNYDSSGCSASDFTLSSTMPSNWGTAFGNTMLNIGPGQSNSTTMTKHSSSSSEGNFTVNATVNRSSNSATATASANTVIVTAPDTAVSTDLDIYEPRSFVTITAHVTSGGAAAGGATVDFTLTDPNGAKSYKTVTADTNGDAVWSFKLGKWDGEGAYSVSAHATYFGLSGNESTPAVYFVASSGGGGTGGGGNGGGGNGGGGKGGGKPTK